MPSVLEKECDYAGLDVKEVTAIARGLSKYAMRAHKLGLLIFGASGTGQLRWIEDAIDHNGHALIVAFLDGDFCGGDGSVGEIYSENGLLRSE